MAYYARRSTSDEKESAGAGNAPTKGYFDTPSVEYALGVETDEVIMNRSSTLFLQGVIVLIGLGALAFLLWEPHVEGRNAHATAFEVYFNDPFLAYAYLGSIPFFVALYQAFTVLAYARQDKVFSPAAVRALRTIKGCALALIGFVAGGVLFLLMNDGEDRAGGVFMAVLITFGAIVMATAAAMVERILRNAVELKAENDLTV